MTERDSERVWLVSSVLVTDWVLASLSCSAVNQVLVLTVSMTGLPPLPPVVTQPPPD